VIQVLIGAVRHLRLPEIQTVFIGKQHVVRQHVTFTGTEIKIRVPQRPSSVQEVITAPVHLKSRFDFSRNKLTELYSIS
jgi:hypothetical protein